VLRISIVGVLGDAVKRLYVCGSFKFLHEIEELECRLKEENIQCEISKKVNGRGILGCLKKVDDADIVYVVNPQGYVGKSVSFDLGYAYAKNKSIFVMNPVDDPPIMNLTNGVLSQKALIELLKENSP
jgi:diphthamide synthase subunit DPH2